MNYGTRVLMVGAPLVVIARYFISLTAVAEAVLLFLWRWCSVGIRLSDMYCLHIRVRQSRSLDLGSSLLLSKLDLLHLVFPLMLPPNPSLSTGYVILFSLDFLLSSKLVPYYLSYCGYMLLFRCINSRPSWPSEIK